MLNLKCWQFLLLVWHLIVAGNLVFLLQAELSFPVNSIYNITTRPPTSLMDNVLYPKWAPLILQAHSVSTAAPLFGRTFRCRWNSCVVRLWVHAERQLWGRAALAQHPFPAVAQSKCLGNSKRNKTYRDNWVFWLLRWHKQNVYVSASLKQRLRDTAFTSHLWSRIKYKYHTLSFSAWAVRVCISAGGSVRGLCLPGGADSLSISVSWARLLF